ncbi:hypothetical protein Q8W71_20160 [Methylobacterium sp. NEAU 140]|uniref:hypothetical protein n=1 Tax=Methylobacterium sp. NEAU 140 TaxID=3064945 RepID=UPI0027353EAC|nr:hypothetical protein [Methylobacterium sp. NEAU 140]MDP4024947.1 hypothetical protein [Methylobacterium sp. NEAU 140]
MRNPPRSTRPPPAPRQLFLSFDAPRLRGLSLAQRRLVLARLAGLMLEATGLPAPEHAHDER